MSEQPLSTMPCLIPIEAGWDQLGWTVVKDEIIATEVMNADLAAKHVREQGDALLATGNITDCWNLVKKSFSTNFLKRLRITQPICGHGSKRGQSTVRRGRPTNRSRTRNRPRVDTNYLNEQEKQALEANSAICEQNRVNAMKLKSSIAENTLKCKQMENEAEANRIQKELAKESERKRKTPANEARRSQSNVSYGSSTNRDYRFATPAQQPRY